MAFETEQDDDVQSLRDELAAAFEADEATEKPAEADSAPKAPKAAKADEEPAQDDETASERARDATGKFAPKTADEPKPLDAGAQDAPTAPPVALSATVKAKWATLDPDVRADIVRREQEAYKGIQDRAEQLKRYEPIEEVMRPHRDRLRIAGVTDAQYIGNLVAADEMLNDPARQSDALRYIIQSYGIDPRAVLGGQQQPNEAQQHPAIQQLSSQVQTLQQQLAARQNQEQQARVSELQQATAKFASDPSNLYFENVKPRMVQLIQAGIVDGKTADEVLRNAYQAATLVDPTVRPLVLQAEREQERQRAETEAREKVARARKAGSSVTGSPTPGSAPVEASSSKSVRELLEEQIGRT